MFVAASSAEEVQFTASVDKRALTTQDTLVLSLTISGTQKVGAPKLPPIEGLNLIYGPAVSSSTRIINGAVSTSRVFQYGFSPTKEGVVIIPGFQIGIKDKQYKSEPIELSVEKATAPTKGAASNGSAEQSTVNISDRIFVEFEADKTEVVLNEQIVLSFRIYFNIPVDGLNYEPPVTQGFLEEPLGKQRSYRKIVKGVEYQVVEIQKALFPLKAGSLEIPAVKAQATLLFKSQAKKRSSSSVDGFFSDPFSDSFFGKRYVRRPVELTADPIKIQVNPLPEEGKPEDFSGAVGDFAIKVSAQPQELSVGDPVTFTMTVTGKGNLKNIQAPTLKGDLDKFKLYEPESKTNILSRQNGIRGEKIFEVVLVPKEEVALTPSVEFSYFNPDLLEYETLKRGPFSLTVNPATTLISQTTSLPLSQKKSVELLSQDIFYIKTNAGGLKPIGQVEYKKPVFMAGLTLPVVFYLGFLLWVRQREKSLLNPEKVRFSQAGRIARQQLKGAKSIKEDKETMALIEKALVDYLASKTKQSQGAINVNEVNVLLAEKGFSEEEVIQIKTILNACELARFSGGIGQGAQKEELIAQANKWLDRAEKVFK